MKNSGRELIFLPCNFDKENWKLQRKSILEFYTGELEKKKKMGEIQENKGKAKERRLQRWGKNNKRKNKHLILQREC